MRRVCLVLLLTAAACARRSPVRPPEDVIPTMIDNLSAKREPDGISLSWSRPTEYAGGGRMSDLGGFEVQRAVDAATEFETIATVGVDDLARFRQRKRFTYVDRGIAGGSTGRYRVVSFTLDRYVSEPSNEVVIRPTD